jgi:hypothetical protein
VLRDAVAAAKNSKAPIQLLVNNEGALINYSLDYHGGEQYPHLQRDNSRPDLLDQIIAPVVRERVGVPECDEFLERYEKCVASKIPVAARPTFNGVMSRWIKSWREVASTPGGHAGLVQACKNASTQAGQSLSAYGCTW